MFEKLKSLGRSLKREVTVYQLVIQDKKTPKLAKLLLMLAVGYLLLPFDIIPDFIPVIGHVDDAVIVRLCY
ncbi:MAG: YkvA family protein [Nitrospiraceae bacterium]